MHPPPSTVDPTRLLTRRELATVLADATKYAQRFVNARRNLHRAAYPQQSIAS
jgi:hypothetical protein